MITQNITKKIAFLTPNLNFRGSCVAIYDYAHYNEVLLNNRSIIITDQSQQHTSDEIAFYWFTNRFPVLMYDSVESLDRILIQERVDVLYIIKYGTNDGFGTHTTPVKTVIHCVFDMSQPHGDVYAGVSESLARKFGYDLYVPHMCSMEPTDGGNLRSELQIPSEAIVGGRIGGKDTFNLHWAKHTISQIVRERSNIYFIFINADRWDTHPQIIVLEATTDMERKKSFYRSLDFVVIPETMGHTFCTALAQSCAYNIPPMIYNGNVWNRAHIDIMGDKGIYFQTPEQLYDLIMGFQKHQYTGKDWNGYRDFTPESVMRQFERVFF